jgi:hypothetical protein
MPKCMSIQPPPSNLEEVTAEVLETPGRLRYVPSTTRDPTDVKQQQQE